MTYEEAADEILDLLIDRQAQGRDPMDYFEVAAELGLHLDFTIETMDRMTNEGLPEATREDWEDEEDWPAGERNEADLGG